MGYSLTCAVDDLQCANLPESGSPAVHTDLARPPIWATRFRSLTPPVSGSGQSQDLYDIVVVGAGILGLATAREILSRHPHVRLLVVDKETVIAAHQTGHNSGVLHAGIYYQPGSLKARLCRAGKAALERYAEEKGIAVGHCGKLVIAADSTELPALEELRRRGEANGVPGLEMLGPAGLRDIEPHAVGSGALWSPSTSIIDYRSVAAAMAEDIRGAEGEIRLGVEVTGISRQGEHLALTAGDDTVESRHVIACAGLQADRLARMTGSDAQEQIVPFRGDYYTLTASAAQMVHGLIYPVPDPRFPFLGIHLTRTSDGRVLAGPNAVLALHREGYRRRDFASGTCGRWSPLRVSADWLGVTGAWALARCGATGTSVPFYVQCNGTSPRSKAAIFCGVPRVCAPRRSIPMARSSTTFVWVRTERSCTSGTHHRPLPLRAWPSQATSPTKRNCSSRTWCDGLVPGAAPTRRGSAGRSPGRLGGALGKGSLKLGLDAKDILI